MYTETKPSKTKETTKCLLLHITSFVWCYFPPNCIYIFVSINRQAYSSTEYSLIKIVSKTGCLIFYAFLLHIYFWNEVTFFLTTVYLLLNKIYKPLFPDLVQSIWIHLYTHRYTSIYKSSPHLRILINWPLNSSSINVDVFPTYRPLSFMPADFMDQIFLSWCLALKCPNLHFTMASTSK